MKRKVSVRLGERTYNALLGAVSHYDRTKSDIIKEAVVEWLEKKGFLSREEQQKPEREEDGKCTL